MRKELIFLLAICRGLLFAQTEGISTEHGFRPGDELNRVVVSIADNLYSGLNVVWDLQEMEVLDNDYKTRFGGAEAVPWLVASYEGLTGHQYLTNEDGV